MSLRITLSAGDVKSLTIKREPDGTGRIKIRVHDWSLLAQTDADEPLVTAQLTSSEAGALRDALTVLIGDWEAQ